MSDTITLLCVFISAFFDAIAILVKDDKVAIVLMLIAIFFMTVAILLCRQSILLYGWDW